MGLFQTIFEGASSRSRSYRKYAKRQEKRAARHRIKLAEEAISFREKEDPREQALFTQNMFGRGLGKSTIADQDRERLTGIQARRMAALKRQHELAVHGLELIKKRHRYQAGRQYAAYGDAILSIAAGAGGGADEYNYNMGGGNGNGDDADTAYLYSQGGYYV